MKMTELNSRKQGLWGRLLSTDHMDIGSNYLLFAIFCGLVGTVLSLVMRLEMVHPVGFGAALLSTSHALVMVFFMVLPALIGGFANWVVPMMIGLDNMVFPKINRLAFWLLIPAFTLLMLALVLGLTGTAVEMLVLGGGYCVAVSMLLSFICVFTTIIAARDADMPLAKLPVFVWSVVIASFLGIMSVPVMLAAVTMTLIHQTMVIGHLQGMLWFFSHPEIYVLLLPAFGIVSQVVVTFAHRPLFAQKTVIGAMLLMGLMGFVLWCENLFAFHQAANDALVNADTGIGHYFSQALPLMALPVAVIIVSWIVTLLRGASLRWSVPLLYVMGFIVISLTGALSASRFFMVSTVAVSENIGPLVSHFHYIVSLSAVFAIFCGWYFWFPKISGIMIRETTGRIQFWLLFLGVHLIFLPQYFALQSVAMLSLIGAVMATLSVLIFLYALVEAVIRQQKAEANPWGEGATTREWQLPSPPKPQKVHISG